MRTSYDDLDDKEPRGCLLQTGVAMAAVIVVVVLGLASCRSCPCPPDMAEIYEMLSAP